MDPVTAQAVAQAAELAIKAASSGPLAVVASVAGLSILANYALFALLMKAKDRLVDSEKASGDRAVGLLREMQATMETIAAHLQGDDHK